MNEELRRKIMKRKEKERKRKKLLQFVFTFVVMAVMLPNLLGPARALQKDDQQSREFSSYCIQPGDTLIGIAKEHGCENEGVKIYVEEVKRMNHLEDDSITVGAYIIIPN